MTTHIWSLLLACIGLVGCPASAGADAGDSKSGSDEARIAAIREMMGSVRRTYPSPKLPWSDRWNVPSFVIKDFSGNGVIELEGGRVVRMDGLTCSAEGVALLRRILLKPGTKVAIAAKSDKIPMDADVWTVEHPAKNYGPSFVGDFAVTSGACAPDVSSNSDNLPRYRALSEGMRRIDAQQR